MKKIIERKKSIGTLDAIDHSLASKLVSKLNEALEKDPNAILVVDSTLNATLTSLASKELNVIYDEEVEITAMEAPKLSKNNRQNVGCGVRCGCYFCFRLFDGSEITEWTDEEQTALCPNCDTDTVIPNIDDAAYLVEAGEMWFCVPVEETHHPKSVNFKEFFGPPEKCCDDLARPVYTVKDALTIAGDNRKNIDCGTQCGCCHCLYVFEGREITSYKNYAALCPNCDHVTVIPESVIPNAVKNGFVVDARKYLYSKM